MGKLVSVLAAFLSLLACQPGGFRTSRTTSPHTAPLAVRTLPGARVVAPLLAEIWESRFFRQSEAVREEIGNNDYALFEKDAPLAALEKNGLACFSRTPGHRDTIFLRADIFAHFDIEMEGVFERKTDGRKFLTILIHEICHDLWANILDEGEKALFCMEGDEFLDDYRQSKSTRDWPSFLRRAGFDDAAAGGGRSFDILDTFIAIHPANTLSGAELFAWFGEQAFAANAKIPERFRKYYRGILAESRS